MLNIVLCSLLAAAPLRGAQDSQADAAIPDTLTVGTKVAPPFVTEESDGKYSGLAIDLLDEIAGELGFEYEVRAYDLAGLLEATASGEVDLAASAMTITAERERQVDFTHPFYTAGLGIAVESEGGLSWLRTLKAVVSPAFVSAIGALTLILLITGTAMWLAERHKNKDQFGGKSGIGHGFWWSAVTMTTVGYGDKAPITLAGRLIALVWMFTSVIIISTFTAAIATSLTLANLGSDIQSSADLKGKRVGAVAASTSEQAVRGLGARVKTYESGPAGLEALASGEIDAFVHDDPVLKWWISWEDADLLVLPETFRPQDYGFATPAGSPLRERLSLAVLEATTRDDWPDRVEQAVTGGR